jgi:hypothetical protein
MKKIIIALTAVAALAAGSAAAQAKVNIDLNIGLPGLHIGHGYVPAYEPVGYYGYDEPECHYATKKIVKWHKGYKIVKFKKVLVCD